MFTLGITGGIGSGKTTVAQMFAELGVFVVDVDDIAREIVATGSYCLQQIAQRYGDTLLLPDGSLDRPALRQIIFHNENEKDWLENLTHPEIRKQLFTQLDTAKSRYRILVSPLLFEKQQQHWVQRTLVVDVPETFQIDRASRRDKASASNIEAVMRSQLSREKRQQLADDVIDNCHGLAHTLAQVQKLHKLYLSLS